MNMLFNTRYYYLTKLFCSVVGLWPYQSQVRKKVIHSIHMLILFSYVPPQIKRLQQVWGNDMDAVCMCMPPIFTIFLCLSKTMTIMLFESKMKMLLREIEREWELISRGKQNTILTTYALKTRKLCIAYTSIMCYGLMCFILAPTITPMLDIVLPRNETRTKGLGFDLDYGVDMQIYWFWLWIHTSMAGVVVIFNIIAADIMFITLTNHICYLFATVRYKLKYVTDSIKESTTSCNICNFRTEYNSCQFEERHLELKQAAAVRECVLSHKKAIESAQLLHYIYAWSLLVGAGLNVITISIAAVQLVSKLFQWAEMMMSAAFVIGVMMHLFFLSLMAQFILDESLDVHESTYSSFWYNMSAIVQKNIILILIRSQSPCQLMAGKLFVMSLENYCAILQTSMSYFTVLASFR